MDTHQYEIHALRELLRQWSGEDFDSQASRLFNYLEILGHDGAVLTTGIFAGIFDNDTPTVLVDRLAEKMQSAKGSPNMRNRAHGLH